MVGWQQNLLCLTALFTNVACNTTETALSVFLSATGQKLAAGGKTTHIGAITLDGTRPVQLWRTWGPSIFGSSNFCDCHFFR